MTKLKQYDINPWTEGQILRTTWWVVERGEDSALSFIGSIYETWFNVSYNPYTTTLFHSDLDDTLYWTNNSVIVVIDKNTLLPTLIWSSLTAWTKWFIWEDALNLYVENYTTAEMYVILKSTLAVTNTISTPWITIQVPSKMDSTHIYYIKWDTADVKRIILATFTLDWFTISPAYTYIAALEVDTNAIFITPYTSSPCILQRYNKSWWLTHSYSNTNAMDKLFSDNTYLFFNEASVNIWERRSAADLTWSTQLPIDVVLFDYNSNYYYAWSTTSQKINKVTLLPEKILNIIDNAWLSWVFDSTYFYKEVPWYIRKIIK